jgi:hypothetical protein
MLFCLTFCFSNLHTKLERQVLFDFSSEDPDPVRIEICFSRDYRYRYKK